MKNIFYIEDNPDFLALLTDTLPEGYSCTPFHEADKALAEYRAGNHPEMVITDVRMPRKTGVQFIRELRGLGYINPIIIATGHISHDEMVQAIRMGVSEILDKPFPLDALFGAIKRASTVVECRRLQAEKQIKMTNVISCLDEIVKELEVRALVAENRLFELGEVVALPGRSVGQTLEVVMKCPHLMSLIEKYKEEAQDIERREGLLLGTIQAVTDGSDRELDELVHMLLKAG